MVQLHLYQFVHGYSTGVCTPNDNSLFRVYAFAMYQMCRVMFLLAGVGGGLGVHPQENLEIWSALGAILGLLRVSS